MAGWFYQCTYTCYCYYYKEVSPSQGWVWCLASHHSNPNVLFSGGWDAAVLAWDVSVGRMIERVNDRCHLLLNYFLIFFSPLFLVFFSLLSASSLCIIFSAIIIATVGQERILKFGPNLFNFTNVPNSKRFYPWLFFALQHLAIVYHLNWFIGSCLLVNKLYESW